MAKHDDTQVETEVRYAVDELGKGWLKLPTFPPGDDRAENDDGFLVAEGEFPQELKF